MLAGQTKTIHAHVYTKAFVHANAYLYTHLCKQNRKQVQEREQGRTQVALTYLHARETKA
jgi:hypothetical protein